MVTISIDPIIFTIGHFAIRWYGLIITSAIFIGILLTGREAERKGFLKEEVFDASVWIIVGGLIGARLFHVLDHWQDHFAVNPISALYIWQGGLAIWGAVTGGLVAASVLAWRRGWRLGNFLDAAAPGLVLAQGIGRLACIITGDSMGKPTSGLFGFAYTNPNALVPELGVYYTPMPVYEVLVNLGIFIILWKIRKRQIPEGMLFLIYLSLYSLERLLLAFTSSYRIVGFGMTQSQIVSLIGIAFAVPIMIWISRKKTRNSEAKLKD